MVHLSGKGAAYPTFWASGGSLILCIFIPPAIFKGLSYLTKKRGIWNLDRDITGNFKNNKKKKDSPLISVFIHSPNALVRLPNRA